MIDAWSISDGYAAQDGSPHRTSDATRQALRAAFGAGEWGAPPEAPPFWVVHAGDTPSLDRPCDLYLEDGTLLTGLRGLPRDLPLGYHVLVPAFGGVPTRLVVAPPRCPQPSPSWGWVSQLYATRSSRSWGIGDLGDLRDLARWSAGLGAGTIVLSPLHANPPVTPQEPSPYFASSRVWRNVLHLRIEDVPGAAELPDLTTLAAAGRALDATRRIDRDAVLALKLPALEQLFGWFEQHAPERDRLAFDGYVRREGPALQRWATYCALAETHGSAWSTWPVEYRHPRSREVGEHAAAHADRVRFHAWCQWHLDRQLAAAGGEGVALVGDLAVGFNSSGADAWAWQDLLALDCRVGAPPDGFNAKGQDWGLPPFVPWKLRAAHYEPFLATVRASLRHMGGARIDHVMGLFRLFVIPPGMDATQGAYVRYRAEEQLALLALEAHRAGAFVVGEDLGTVEDDILEALAAAGVLSYRLLWFEDDVPATFPRQALAAITTHDLPTVAGLWTGSDLDAQREIGMTVAEEGAAFMRERITEAAGSDEDASLADVLVAAHRALAEAPSLLVVGTLDDALGVPERPNMPGTIDEWPNWRLPLPKTIEEIAADPQVLAVAAALQEGREIAARRPWPPPAKTAARADAPPVPSAAEPPGDR